MGSVVLEDVGGSISPWGFAWVMFAAAAGSGLVAAAASLFKRNGDDNDGELAGGYNALAAMVDRR
jgi:hypothetical protein